eukprot:GFUD01045010.1.p1 GENE.GFUD01045010.1~~GFUD01045010.1.p1  ORF type:complete len:1669 (+),score=312.22 GFUD01045010.1:50-5056(+)
MLTVVLLFVAAVSALSDEDLEPGQEVQILKSLALKFRTAENDFTQASPNSAYFPFVKSRKENERIKRLNSSTVNSDVYMKKITEQLKTWRGFEEIDSAVALTYANLMFETFYNLSPDLRASFLQSSMSADDLQKLPLSWQYLLPHQFYDDLGLDGAGFAELVNSSPGNTAMLYKIAMVLRDESVAMRDAFMNNLNLPDQYREDMGYILGYRWGIESEADSNFDYTMSTLLHLPSDVVMGINNATFDNLNIADKLEDTSMWGLASPQSKVAWFTKFEGRKGWREVAGTPHHMVRHGHLLSGAPLDKLRELKGNKEIETSLLAEVLDNTEMNPLRVQELWEALADVDREKSFIAQASNLDVSQILSHYDTPNIIHTPHQHHVMLETAWFSEDKINVPWVNSLAIAFSYMNNQEFVSWTYKELQGLGRFLAILSPAEIDLIPAIDFNSTMLGMILSSTLSLPQLNSIYLKYLDNNYLVADATLNPILLSALPSATILSANPPFIWSQDKTNLLVASAKYSPGQMHSLHEISKPGHWASANLSAILSTHPQCMSDVNPREFRVKLDYVVSAIYTAGPDKFHSIATKVQKLPRHLLMAWLEEAHTRPGSKRLPGEWWNSDVLLDRVTSTSVPDSGTINPFPSHPMAAQFNRFTSANRSMLPSLALAGMSCHCINLVETPDTMEVLALYRYHSESQGDVAAMPSSSRRCWAKKVRQFLHLKALLFNVTVNSESELLSLLTTADIKTVGGEIFLTWGGPALASITHPEVMHEVLMAVGHTRPHLYLRNGVTYTCMKIMANALLDTMMREEGGINFRVLAHVHNLVPYTDTRVLKAGPADIRLYVSSVLSPTCKAVCLMKKERELVRQMILQSYGPPSTWLPLDLVELGDLLVVMARSDLAAVNPTSLRMASAQLASSTLFASSLTEIRSQSSPLLYHEACGAWLGGKDGRQSDEAVAMFKQWKMLANFIVVGNFLQVEVLLKKIDVPKPRSGGNEFRRKRQAQTLTDGIDYKSIYTIVMNDMKAKFDAKELSDTQKMEATRVITETQKMLGDSSFAVLGLEREGKTQSEVLAVLAEYKEAGNMSEAQNVQVQMLAVDTQVRMIQELVQVLNLSADDLDLTEDELGTILARHTFVLRSPGAVSTTMLANRTLPFDETSEGTDGESVADELLINDAETTSNPASIESKNAPEASPSEDSDDNSNNAELTTDATPASSGTTAPSPGTDAPPSPGITAPPSPDTVSSDRSSSASTSSTASTISSTVSSAASSSTPTSTAATTSSTSAPLNPLIEEENDFSELLKNTELTDFIIFSAYEPESAYFTTLPSMDSITLSCDVVIAAGSSASSISSSDIARMSSKEVMNCLSTLGHLPWPPSVTKSIWKAVKEKVDSLQDSTMLPIKRDEMLQFGTLLPAIAAYDSELLDMGRKNIDGISLLGRFRTLSSDDPAILNLVQLFITLNNVSPTNPFTSTEAASLGQLLCGLREDQWRDLITPSVFSSILTEHLALLDCSVSATTSVHLATMLTTLYGSTANWTSSDLLSTGWMASTLSPDQLSQLTHHAMEGLTGQAVKHLSRQQLGSLSHHQLSKLSPHAASFISREQLLPYTNMHRRRGIRAAGGEDEKLVDVMEDIESEMQMGDMKDMMTSPEPEPTGGVGANYPSGQVLLCFLVIMVTFGL